MAAERSTAAPEAPRFEETQRAFLLLKLVTEVNRTGVHVRLSPLPGTRHDVPFEDIESVEVATYDAAEHGGWHWGLRIGPGGTTAYRLSGSRGVRLGLADGDTLFVGSRRPRELRDAVATGFATV